MTAAYRKDAYAYPVITDGTDPKLFKNRSARGITYLMKYQVKTGAKQYSKSVPNLPTLKILDELRSKSELIKKIVPFSAKVDFCMMGAL